MAARAPGRFARSSEGHVEVDRIEKLSIIRGSLESPLRSRPVPETNNLADRKPTSYQLLDRVLLL